jgi:hypothetical protein
VLRVRVVTKPKSGGRDLHPRLQIPLMPDNETAPVVNKNKRHRKEKRTSANILPSKKADISWGSMGYR